MQDSRLYSLDFLKFVAALMITNSHFQPLYEDVSPSLATFGVPGNALFFFVSGFNVLLVFAIIVLAAYLLKVMTSLFLAVLSKEDLEWKEIVRL